MKPKRNRISKQINNETLAWYANKLQPEFEKVIYSLGYILIKLSFVRENQMYYLRVAISHNDRLISLDDCELVSKNLEKILDKTNSIPFPYHLEVESPGIKDTSENKELVLNYKDMSWGIRTN